MKQNLLLASALDYAEHTFATELPSDYAYHNFSHTLQVFRALEELTNLAGISSGNRTHLLLAAVFHDLGYIKGPALHEQRSAEMASDFLLSKGMPEDGVACVKELILATVSGEFRSQGLSDYLRDADLSYLGLPDFFTRAELYRKELMGSNHTFHNESEWIEFNLAFFKKHSYITPEANSVYGPLKTRHQRILEEKLRNCRG